MTRQPVVAGRFYTDDADSLKREIAGFSKATGEEIDAMGVISPHAGYMYSGEVAGNTLSSVKAKTCYILLGTNHSGQGKRFGIDTGRTWKTPLGDVTIDTKLAEAILKDSSYIEKDTESHDNEHSIEVQLPFLQCLNDAFSFVPISISSADSKACINIGNELADTLQKFEKDVTIVASSDMTHYEPQESAKKKDMLAIERILQLDVAGFLKTIKKYDITMCGALPTAIMMQACVALGAKKTKLIKYMTSGDTSGDYSSVVGYAGVVIY